MRDNSHGLKDDVLIFEPKDLSLNCNNNNNKKSLQGILCLALVGSNTPLTLCDSYPLKERG